MIIQALKLSEEEGYMLTMPTAGNGHGKKLSEAWTDVDYYLLATDSFLEVLSFVDHYSQQLKNSIEPQYDDARKLLEDVYSK